MPYEDATVRIAVELRVRSADGSGRWEWRACQIQPEAEEFIYTHSDMCAAVRGYAALASYAIPRAKYPAWRIVIRGHVTGIALATYEWEWCDTRAKYVPTGAPWCWWPPLEILPVTVLRGAMATRERPFKPAKVCGSGAACLMAAKVPAETIRQLNARAELAA